MIVKIKIKDLNTDSFYEFEYVDNTSNILDIASQMKSDLGIEDSDCCRIECKVYQ